MTSLRETGIFRLQPLLKNVYIKRSAFIKDGMQRQTLCLVRENNEIILRSHSLCDESGKVSVNLKTVMWFKNNKKCIQEVCFNQSGAMLLVLCKLMFADFS